MKNYFKSGLMVLSVLSTLAVTAQTPVLSSNPSAAGVVFLDFDGHTVTGTSWNTSGPIVCGASGFNSSQITTIFDRVSEDYRPFNVNVTTDSTKYASAPINQRTRVILTVSSSWYGNTGGVAFVGSFTWGDNTPCFVFTALLGYNVKNVAEAASHEAGHTLGLFHQATYDVNCIKTSDYNTGTGTGEIGWAPIMGVGYYQNLTLWNNGPNSFGCTSLQSDLDIITTSNGFTYRTDDYSGTFSGASNIPFVANQFTLSGIIERNSDMDMIKFNQPYYSRFILNAVPYNVGSGNAGSDLDMQVSLYNSSQTLLSVFNPGTLLSSVVDTFLNAGTYYIKVEGKGNIYAPNYASLGSYSLAANIVTSALPLRKLELHGTLNGDKHQLNWVIEADEQVTSQILESSTDGNNFSPVVESPVNARAYSYKPNFTSAVQYRLNVTFDNGRQYYSNIVTLRPTGAMTRPQLISNFIYNSTISVSSPGHFNYTIYDYNGRPVSKGGLTNGTNLITATGFPGGLYMIRFDNGTEQWTDKFVRQ